MNEKQYNNIIKKIVKLMSMESKVNIVGSAKIKETYTTVIMILLRL